MTPAEWPLLRGKFQPGLQGASVYSKLDWWALSVARFALGVSAVAGSPPCGQAKG